MSTLIIDTYSDQDMQCPAEWENGFKEARIIQVGTAERVLSHPFTGEWAGSQFAFSISDYDRRFRQQFASSTDRYWTQPLIVRMTTRENRAILGVPYTVFVGPIVEPQPSKQLVWDVTLGDLVSQGLLSDQAQIPWRKIGDGFITQVPFAPVLSSVSDELDRAAPEPIIYGSHRRHPDVDPASPQGFCVKPIYLGQRVVAGDAYHTWMLAGHAVSDIPSWRVTAIDGTYNDYATEGSDWLVPHHAGHDAQFGAAYEDITSNTYGNLRRYTLFYGLVTDLTVDPDTLTDPDACALGHKTLTVAVDGIEETGDGTGPLITKRLLAYQHFLINFVANHGISSYQSGAWRSNPTWDVFGTLVPIVEEASFTAADAIADLRLPVAPGSPGEAGYIVAATIGFDGQQSSRELIARWNRSCNVRFGVTHFGELRVVMLSPTQAIKDAAPLYEDVNMILRESFGTQIFWSEHANRVPFKADFDYATSVWKTVGMADWQPAIDNWGRDITGAERDYPYAPGITAAYHNARLEVLLTNLPICLITLEATIGPDLQNQSLGYLDLGDYLRYRHFDAVSGFSTEVRLAQVTRHQVQAGARRVLIEAIDCEDLIGTPDMLSYDRPPPDVEAPSEGDPGGPNAPTNLSVFEDP